MKRRCRSRPITPGERGPAFALASALLVALAALALLTHPPAQRRATPPSTAPARPTTPPPAAPDRHELLADARLFTLGYLAYLYGGADTQSIPRVTFALRRALAQQPPPAKGRRSPERRVRLLDLQVLSASTTRARVVITAVDETGATFAIHVALEHHSVGGWEASSLEH